MGVNKGGVTAYTFQSTDRHLLRYCPLASSRTYEQTINKSKSTTLLDSVKESATATSSDDFDE